MFKTYWKKTPPRSISILFLLVAIARNSMYGKPRARQYYYVSELSIFNSFSPEKTRIYFRCCSISHRWKTAHRRESRRALTACRPHPRAKAVFIHIICSRYGAGLGRLKTLARRVSHSVRVCVTASDNVVVSYRARQMSPRASGPRSYPSSTLPTLPRRRGYT